MPQHDIANNYWGRCFCEANVLLDLTLVDKADFTMVLKGPTTIWMRPFMILVLYIIRYYIYIYVYIGSCLQAWCVRVK